MRHRKTTAPHPRLRGRIRLHGLGVQSAPAEPKVLSMEALEAQEHQRRMAEEA